MKKFIILCLLILTSASAVLAEEKVDVSGLTETQKAELMVQVAKMKEGDDPLLGKIKKVGDIAGFGKQIGHEIGEAAKEVGVAADELLKTDVGKLTAILIAWKIAGKDMVDLTDRIVGYIAGFILFFALVPMWFYLFRRMCVVQVTKVEYPKEALKKVKYFEYYDIESEDVGATRLVMLVVLIIILVAIFIVMF